MIPISGVGEGVGLTVVVGLGLGASAWPGGPLQAPSRMASIETRAARRALSLSFIRSKSYKANLTNVFASYPFGQFSNSRF